MILAFEGMVPKISDTALVVETAAIIGDVVIGEESSIWFHCVVRGDMHHIRIGKRTNIQDLCVLHVRFKTGATILGDDITVGHRAILHACTVGNRVLVGMGSIVMDGAVIGEDSIVGAGALVAPGTVVPPRSLVVGAPARVKRPVTDAEIAGIADSALRYVEFANKYRNVGATKLDSGS
jgi:carbonic anhydrase/acetyltransferase-like protein (isoleucine patch superfamily)